MSVYINSNGGLKGIERGGLMAKKAISFINLLNMTNQTIFTESKNLFSMSRYFILKFQKYEGWYAKVRI